jgi:hypothetical protein
MREGRMHTLPPVSLSRCNCLLRFKNNLTDRETRSNRVPERPGFFVTDYSERFAAFWFYPFVHQWEKHLT